MRVPSPPSRCYPVLAMKSSLGVFAAACLLSAAMPASAQVKVTRAADRITVEINGKPDTAFFTGSDVPKPYLHPLRSASGKIVSRRYPMENIEGETRDHPHHRGVWFSHGDVNGFDFWGNEPGRPPKAGKIVLQKVVGAIFDWVSPDGKRLLEENRKMVFYSDPSLRTIDFDITLKALDKVVFGDTKEGTFAIRLAAGLEEPEKGQPALPKRTGKMVSAEGAVGEPNVWGKRSNWVDHYGEVEGETLGIAILPGIRPTGIPALTACSRPTSSACTISSATRRRTAASLSPPVERCGSAIASSCIPATRSRQALRRSTRSTPQRSSHRERPDADVIAADALSGNPPL